jgi:hypothetical protein
VRGLEAERYAVMVELDYAADAERLAGV